MAPFQPRLPDGRRPRKVLSSNIDTIAKGDRVEYGNWMRQLPQIKTPGYCSLGYDVYYILSSAGKAERPTFDHSRLYTHLELFPSITTWQIHLVFYFSEKEKQKSWHYYCNALQRQRLQSTACCVVLTNAPLLLNSNVPLLMGDFFLLSQTVIDKVSKAHVFRKHMNLCRPNYN